jgi:hypothetical protein
MAMQSLIGCRYNRSPGNSCRIVRWLSRSSSNESCPFRQGTSQLHQDCSVLSAMATEPERFTQWLVDTWQHYDESMPCILFDEFCLPNSYTNLDVGSASHAHRTAQVMETFEPVLLVCRPGLVVVGGGVNAALACALVAAKLCMPVAQVEAGLCSLLVRNRWRSPGYSPIGSLTICSLPGGTQTRACGARVGSHQ